MVSGVLSFRAVVTLPLLMVAMSFAAARADGPHIAFHATQGAYTVTLFSAPDPLTAGPAELTLLVQRAADGTLLPTARATGQLALASQPVLRFSLTPGGAGERQLPIATVRLTQAGTYALDLRVTAPDEALAEFHGTLPVIANHGQRNTVLWAVFLPGVLVAFFLANQYGKAQLRRARARAAFGSRTA